MPVGRRSNPLALAVLVALFEEPLHPYEIANRLKARKKHESVRLNYGSLYAVVESLQHRGYIAARSTDREGRLPPRTIYEITDAGKQEIQDWMSDLVSTPVHDYPSFEAALSFLPALPPDEALRLLESRMQSLEVEQARDLGQRELMARNSFPRIFWIEGEFRAAMRQAELDFVRQLVQDMRTGELDGLEWWRQVYARGDVPVYPPGIKGGNSYCGGGHGES